LVKRSTDWSVVGMKFEPSHVWNEHQLQHAEHKTLDSNQER
jgi:hypothetical protein